MALNTLNTDAIAFKRLSGKAHTQQGFSVSEESVASNISMSFTTVFGDNINPTPITSGLTTLYSTDGKVEKVRFDLEIIPDTFIGTNRSQGYRLKLPLGYTASGALGAIYSGGTKLYTTLGKLQIVPPSFGKVKPDGSTEYDPILYQTNGTTVITKFDSINWVLDCYNGILFIQDPPTAYDISALRPGYVEAFLFVGSYLDKRISSGGTVTWNNITNKPATFTPSPHTHPISGVTGLQSALNSKINLSEKGVAGGVTPLDTNNLVPLIHIPSIFKEVYVVSNIAARTAKFVASGTTGYSAGKVVSFEGLRVYVLNCTGAPELPPGTTGSCESIDTTGFLKWSAITSSQVVNNSWASISGKPPLVNQIIGGAGINVLPIGGTGYTNVSVKVDDEYIETTVPQGELRIIPGSIDTSRLKFQNGITGTTGQFIVIGTGNTLQAINYPLTGVSTVTAQNGVSNVGTVKNPILVGQVDVGDGTIEATTLGLKVKNSSIGINKLSLGSSPNKINADLIPIHTGSSYTLATDVGTAIEQLSVNINNLKTKAITGATNIGTGNGQLVSNFTGNTIHVRNLKKGSYITLTQTSSDVIIGITGLSITGNTNIIGPSEDGTYNDGLFTDFVPTTPTGTAIDKINEVLKALAPLPAPDLNQVSGLGTFVSGKLSFGPSKNDIGYTNVGTNAGNTAIDINGSYLISGTRLGILSSSINGILNDTTSGGGGFGSIPYANDAFSDGDKGKLVLYKNGSIISQLWLTGTTASTSNSRLSVSALGYVKFQSGQPLSVMTYRTGTFNIPVSAMTTGYNYIKIIHSGNTFNRQTNFLEWVYDNDNSNIGLIAPSGLTNLTLGGTKYISGVNYHTNGTATYQGTFSNVYKNVYSDSPTAIDFVSRENLGTMTVMDVTGGGIVNRTGSPLQTLPNLNTAVSNPQNTNITVLATLPINVSSLLGNVGSTGRIRSSVSINHPFSGQSYNGGESTLTGFLFYNINQLTVLNNETFEGEVDRLEARDYSLLTYFNVNGGIYGWSSNQNLISGNVQHNTGLLVFNGELLYPNNSYLTSTYGITNGNFSAVSNGPIGNPNYTTASGIRNYYRKFKSANGTTQSTLTFTIQHTGTNVDFLTNGGTGGVPSGNNIKLEFLIMRSGGAIHGWANPFASSGNPEGIANTSSSHTLNTTTVSCTLATTPRVAFDDIVIVRIYVANGYTNRILNLAVTNI